MSFPSHSGLYSNFIVVDNFIIVVDMLILICPIIVKMSPSAVLITISVIVLCLYFCSHQTYKLNLVALVLCG